MSRRGYYSDDAADEFGYSDMQTENQPPPPLTKAEWIQDNLDCLSATFHSLMDYLGTFGMPHILNNLAFDDFCDFCYANSFH